MSKTVAESMSSSIRPQWQTRGPEVNDKPFTDFCECEFHFMPVLHKIILLIKTRLLHSLFLSIKGYVYNMDHNMDGAEDLRSKPHTFKRFLFQSSLVLWVECLPDCTSAGHLPIWFHLKGVQPMSSGTATQCIQ